MIRSVIARQSEHELALDLERGGCAWRLLRWGMLACALVAPGCSVDSHAPRSVAAGLPRAIVLVTLDTMRADHLSIHGYARQTSPGLERIAAQGVRFERAISPLPTTDPAHLTMLTGLYPRTHGVWANGVLMADPGLPNLAKWAQAQGYRTASFISRKHLIPSELDLLGFDHEDGPDERVRPGEETIEAAQRWIERYGDDPFFLWLHLFDPHEPYDSPAEFQRRWRPADAPESERVKNLPGRPAYAPEMLDVIVSEYDGALAYTDHLAEAFLDWLDAQLPAGEEALLVITSDHGEILDELDSRMQYAFDHGDTLHQGGLEVPWLIRWPGQVPAGRVVEEVVELVDLAPTLFDLMGVPGFATQGRSRAASIAGKQATPGPDLAFTQRRVARRQFAEDPSAIDQFAVQDRRYKLIVSLPSRRTELYDLEKDPFESRDLASELPAERDRLLGAFDAWIAKTPLDAKRSAEIPADKVEALRALGYLE